MPIIGLGAIENILLKRNEDGYEVKDASITFLLKKFKKMGVKILMLPNCIETIKPGQTVGSAFPLKQYSSDSTCKDVCQQIGLAECFTSYGKKEIEYNLWIPKTDFYEVDMLYLCMSEDALNKGESNKPTTFERIKFNSENNNFNLIKQQITGFKDIYYFDSRQSYIEAAKSRHFNDSYQVTDSKPLVEYLRNIEQLFEFNVIYRMHQRFINRGIGHGYRPHQLQDFGKICNTFKKFSKEGNTRNFKEVLSNISYDLQSIHDYEKYREILLESDNAVLISYFTQYFQWLDNEYEKHYDNCAFLDLDRKAFWEVVDSINNPHHVHGLEVGSWLRF